MFLYTALTLLICSSACLGEDEGVTYDTYTGEPTTTEQLEQYEALNTIGNCTLRVLPCDPDDWRRVDGSCNNLKNPSRGTYLVPMYRMLPADFYNDNEIRKSKSGKDLEEERHIRLTLMQTGKTLSKLTIATPGYGVHTWMDIGSIHDAENQLLVKTNCCDPEHYYDQECAPILLKKDDPIHKFSGIKCLNMTRPLYLQDFGCTRDITPSPVAKATPTFDLSHVYNALNDKDLVLRQFQGGRLKVEEENGRIWPINGPNSECVGNPKNATRCFKHQKSALLPTIMNIMFNIRYHNHIANELAAVNPCWDDETLYNHAKDINIASALQIYMYEWMATLIGHKNLVKSGVIMDGDSPGFRDLYDDTLYPMVSAEFSFGMRWFHTIQETDGKMYDTKGNYVKTFSVTDVMQQPGYLALDDHLDYATQGCFRQATSDYPNMDYNLAEQGFGSGIRRAGDTAANDLKKSRLFGAAPYIDYIYLCTGINITCFEDLLKYDITFTEKVPLLMEVYEDVSDIDLMAGMWVEKPLPGGWIPNTMACIMKDNMLRSQKSDRFWYERPNRPHAFTAEQLLEIRKMTYASLLCAVGDKVTEVQPKAFEVISSENPLTPCSEIPQMGFSAWAACGNCEENIVY